MLQCPTRLDNQSGRCCTNPSPAWYLLQVQPFLNFRCHAPLIHGCCSLSSPNPLMYMPEPAVIQTNPRLPPAQSSAQPLWYCPLRNNKRPVFFLSCQYPALFWLLMPYPCLFCFCCCRCFLCTAAVLCLAVVRLRTACCQPEYCNNGCR